MNENVAVRVDGLVRVFVMGSTFARGEWSQSVYVLMSDGYEVVRVVTMKVVYERELVMVPATVRFAAWLFQ
jgi:hypothetical protein